MRASEPAGCPSRTRRETIEAIDRELEQIVAQEDQLDVRKSRCLREVDRLEIWRDFGYPSIIAYLEYRLQRGPKTVVDQLRVARALGELPKTEAALERGELSRSAVREVTRVADAKTESAWLERVRGKSLREVEELVRGHTRGAHPDDPKDPDLRPRKVTIEMLPATYALWRQTVANLSDEAGTRLDEDQVIAALCLQSMEPATTEPPTRARHQVAVTICEHCHRGWQDGAGAVIEIEPAAVDVALCDGQHIGSLDAEHPARAAQNIPPATRRLVWRRDHGKCRVNGCRSARNLDVHHVRHRADGGAHDPSNLAVLCSGCHLALHRGLIVVCGTAPDFVFTRLHESRSAARPSDVETTALHSNAATATHSAITATHAHASNGIEDDRSRERRTAAASSSVVEVVTIDRAIDRVAPPPRRDRLAEATLRVQARDTLVASGFRPCEASTAVDAALAYVGATVTLEQLLPEAFRRCKMPSG